MFVSCLVLLQVLLCLRLDGVVQNCGNILKDHASLRFTVWRQKDSGKDNIANEIAFTL